MCLEVMVAAAHPKIENLDYGIAASASEESVLSKRMHAVDEIDVRCIAIGGLIGIWGTEIMES